MREVIERFFYSAVQEYLERVYEYDFIAEVLEIEERLPEGTVTIGYRGIYGEYADLTISESLHDLLEAL